MTLLLALYLFFSPNPAAQPGTVIPAARSAGIVVSESPQAGIILSE
jgi:hypothetical protein